MHWDREYDRQVDNGEIYALGHEQNDGQVDKRDTNAI